MMATQTDRVYHFMIYHPTANTKLRGQVACVFCNKRKLKCSKTKPCHQCSKRNRECIYVHELEEVETMSRSEEDEILKENRKRDAILKSIDYYNSLAVHWRTLLDNFVSSGDKASRRDLLYMQDYDDSQSQKCIRENEAIVNPSDSALLAIKKKFLAVMDSAFPGIIVKLPKKDDTFRAILRWVLANSSNDVSCNGNFLNNSSVESVFRTLEYCILISIGSYYTGDSEVSKKMATRALKLYQHLLFSKQILIQQKYLQRWLGISLVMSFMLEMLGYLYTSLSILNIAFQCSYQNQHLKNSDMLIRVVIKLSMLSINEYERTHWINYAQHNTQDYLLLVDTEILKIGDTLKNLERLDIKTLVACKKNLQNCLDSLKQSSISRKAQDFFSISCFLLMLEFDSMLESSQQKMTSIFGKLKKKLNRCDQITHQLLLLRFGDLFYKWSTNVKEICSPTDKCKNFKSEVFSDKSYTCTINLPKYMSLEEDVEHNCLQEHQNQEFSKSMILTSAYFTTSTDVLYGM